MTKGDDAWLVEGARQDAQSITREWLPVGQRMIDGVTLTEARPVITGYGYLVEMFRGEWSAANRVDQIFMSSLVPGAVSAWHAHALTTDRFFVVAGFARIVLYDHREDSPTRGVINELRLGSVRPGLLVVPPRVWHGVQCIGPESAIVVNAVDRAYEYDAPDHWRIPPDSGAIPFSFQRAWNAPSAPQDF